MKRIVRFLSKLDNALVLAPMEGVIDAAMRRRLTGLGNYSRCVTEFVRVTDVLLPDRVFYRLCPELNSDGRTEHGVPVFLQLLGCDPSALAVNAQRAVALGAPGVDLNFGCPAKTVNNSQGGSILLREPARVEHIVARVREAVPSSVPVTVKIRLGYEHSDDLLGIVQGIERAGADELVIHARTKFDGYRPPAHWSLVRQVIENCAIPVIINGEIWTVKDWSQARSDSGCQRVMLGRGALAAPDLPQRIEACQNGLNFVPMSWLALLDEVEAQFIESDSQSPRHVGNRTKQWLAYLRRDYIEAVDLFTRMRSLHQFDAIRDAFAANRSYCRDRAV